MAKKITIEGENLLDSLNDDWGGTNETQETQTVYGTEVPSGKEWGVNRGEVERFIKGKMSSQDAEIGNAVKGVVVNNTEVSKDANGKVSFSVPAVSTDISDPNNPNAAQAGAVAEELNGLKSQPFASAQLGEQSQDGSMVNLDFYNDNGDVFATVQIPAAQEIGDVTYPTVATSLATPTTVKLGSQVTLNWTYQSVTRSEGEVTLDYTAVATVVVTARIGQTVIHRETFTNVVTGGANASGSLTLQDEITGAGTLTLSVQATANVGEEVKTASSSKTVTVITMNLATTFSPAERVNLTNGFTDGQTVQIPYTYTVPSGTTLHTFIDGVEENHQTISGTGRGYIYLTASELSAGRHNVQMVAADSNGLLSDVVIVDFLKAGGTDAYLGMRHTASVGQLSGMPLAYEYGSDAMELAAEQFGDLTIDFSAWNADSLSSTVRVQVEGVTTQTLSAGRTLQTLTQRFDTSGDHSMTVSIMSGDSVLVTRTFSVSVSAAVGVTEVETIGYREKLTATGRSNSEENPADWGGITSFSGVDWRTNGWNTDNEGVTALLLTNGASATIDINPFIIDATDGDYSIQASGMTLEMEVKISQVLQRGAAMVSCLWDNGGEGYPMGISITTEKASLLFGGVERIKTAEKVTDADGNYLDADGNIVEDESLAADLYVTRSKGVERNIALGQWVKIAFVVTPVSGEYGLGMIYINGVLSGAARYSGSLLQAVPQGIDIVSEQADIRVRSVRYYRIPLIADEELANYIIDRPTAVMIQSEHAANAVGDQNNTTDSDGNIAISRDTLQQKGRGTLTIIRSTDGAEESGLGSGNGTGLSDLFACVDKKKNFRADVVIWEPPIDTNGNKIGEGFRAENVRIRIQGTSSVKYPYKNIRIYLTTAQGGTRALFIGGVDVTETAEGYALRGSGNSIEQPVLCAKTDFVDSSLAGNTGGAHLFDATMQSLELLTPPQQHDARVRQSVDGLPCDIFCGTAETGTLNYAGQFVLNNEKSKSGKIFGMEGIEGFSGTEDNPISIALEALNNSSPMTLFQPAGSANSTALQEQLAAEFDNGFEFNFPEDAFWADIDEGNADHDAVPGARAAVKALFGWIYDCFMQTAGVQAETMTAESPDYGNQNGWSGKSKWVCQKFKTEASQHFNINHLLSYYIIINYFGGKDQLAKNILWRTWDGVKWYSTFYDGDTWEAIRNDAFVVYLYNITRDSYDSERSKYAFEGHNSWLWCLVLANFENEMRQCADRIRATLTTANMLSEFTGAMIGNWSARQYNKSGKLKYIDTIDTLNYVYTLTGSRKEHITQFLTDRARLIDAQYGCGEYTGDVVTFTVVRNASDAYSSLDITSGDLYYFGYKLNGIWLQGPTKVDEGDEITLTFSQTLSTNDPLMLGGASCIKELDLTGMGSQLNGTIGLSLCTMLERLVMPATNGVANAPLNLGNTSKLQYVDITGQTATNTGAVGVFDLSRHTRLTTLLAGGTNLTRVVIPEGCPIDTLTLPSTIDTLTLRFLPNLSSSGLTLQGTQNVVTFNFASCPNLNWQTLLGQCQNVQYIRVEGITGKVSYSFLTQYLNKQGISESGIATSYPTLVGTVMLNETVTDEQLAELRTTFKDLEIIECQYSVYEFDDTENDPACVTNLENGTSGYDEYDQNGNLTHQGYVASGHAVKVRNMMKPVFGKVETDNTSETFGKWVGKDMNGNNYAQMADGTTVNNTGTDDAMMLLPHCWYKGINDFKNQKKYICWSALENEPISSATSTVKTLLNDSIKIGIGVLVLANITTGESTIESEGIVQEVSNYNLYKVSVEGMKQVRWPGFNNQSYCACFLDPEGVIINTFTMAVSNLDFDFLEDEGDYIFTSVPEGAASFVFSSKAVHHGVQNVIVTDSEEIEAIEPDWVEHKQCLVGIYQASVDGMSNLRSVTGATVRRGTGTSTTGSWTYDALGNPTGFPPSTMNYTMKDFQNLSRMRGSGYQLIDYEMSKFVGILFYCLQGTLNSQAICGDGSASATTTGYSNAIGNANSYRGQFTGNKCLGLESFFGCFVEWMDNCSVNVSSYTLFYKGKMTSGATTKNGMWSIYDKESGVERNMLAPSTVTTTSTGGYIKRVRNGRFCDLVPTTLNGTSTSRYSDYYYYSTSGRVLGRSYSSGNVYGGVAFAHATYASSVSTMGYGSRLAFRGDIVITE